LAYPELPVNENCKLAMEVFDNVAPENVGLLDDAIL